MDYINIDINILENKKIEVLESEFENEGFAFFVKLLLKIYREGYFIPFDERNFKVFTKKNFFDFDNALKILQECLRLDLFNYNMFQKYRILTSKEIQERYLKMCDRRKKVWFTKEHLLFNPEEFAKDENLKIESIIIEELSEDTPALLEQNAEETDINVNINTQKKVKEIKLNQIDSSDIIPAIDLQKIKFDEVDFTDNSKIREWLFYEYFRVKRSYANINQIDELLLLITNDEKRFKVKTAAKIVQDSFKDWATYQDQKEKNHFRFLVGIIKGKKNDTWAKHEKDKAKVKTTIVKIENSQFTWTDGKIYSSPELEGINEVLIPIKDYNGYIVVYDVETRKSICQAFQKISDEDSAEAANVLIDLTNKFKIGDK